MADITGGPKQIPALVLQEVRYADALRIRQIVDALLVVRPRAERHRAHL